MNINSAYIELTSNCNLKCLHCYHEDINTQHTLDSDIIDKLLSDLEDCGCKSIVLSGGEPFLYNKLFDIIDQYHSIFEITIVTNATLLSREYIELLENKIKGIQISIDGTSEEENDSIRGFGVYQKVKKSLLLLSETSIDTIVRTTITNNRFNNIDLYIKSLIELGVNRINFQVLNTVGRAKNNKIDLEVDAATLTEVINNVKSCSQKYDIDIEVPSMGLGYCPILDNKSFNIKINYCGNVYLCQRFDEKNILSIGNIYTSKINSMILSDKFKNIIMLMNLSKKMIESCKDCKYNLLCDKPCPADIMKDSIFDYKDEYCNERIKMIRK